VDVVHRNLTTETLMMSMLAGGHHNIPSLLTRSLNSDLDASLAGVWQHYNKQELEYYIETQISIKQTL